MPIPQDTDTLPQETEAPKEMAVGVTAGTESNAAGTVPEAAVAAMDKVANQAESLS